MARGWECLQLHKSPQGPGMCHCRTSLCTTCEGSLDGQLGGGHFSTDRWTLSCVVRAGRELILFWESSLLGQGGKGNSLEWTAGLGEQGRASGVKTAWKTDQGSRPKAQNMSEYGKGRTWTACRNCRECESKRFSFESSWNFTPVIEYTLIEIISTNAQFWHTLDWWNQSCGNLIGIADVSSVPLLLPRYTNYSHDCAGTNFIIPFFKSIQILPLRLAVLF